MNNEESNLFNSICEYCINKYQILNSAPIISNFIYQICRHIDMDVPSIQGILIIEVNGYKRQFAHCFNVYNGSIIDATIFQFAIINKTINNIFPFYVVGNIPEHIDYIINNEIKLDFQTKFSKDYIEKAIHEIKNMVHTPINKFDSLEDSRKENLFFWK